jgi:hypothetical protein
VRSSDRKVLRRTWKKRVAYENSLDFFASKWFTAQQGG